jgi:hypothetical protein
VSNTNVSFTLTASDKTQAAFASVGNGLGQLKTKSDTLFSAFSGGVAGGLATGLLGAGFTAAIKGAIDDLDKLNEASERLGVSVEDLSALNFAGKMNGLEFEDMTTALTKLSVKMQEAAAGSKEAGALFSDIGVKVTDAGGKLKSADSVFAEIADRFSQFEDGASKTALAVDTFGKSGAKLVPILNGGAEGLKSMREEAASLGGIIDGKLAKQAADFNDNMDKLSILAGSVAKAIAGEMIPSLNKLAAEFIAARAAGMGFWESLTGIGLSDPSKTAGQQIKSLTADIDKLTASRNAAMATNRTDGGSIDTGDMEAEIGRLTRRREYFKSIQRMEALEGADANYGNEGRGKASSAGKGNITRTPTGEGKGKGKTAAKEVAEATAEATAYGKAMEALAKLTGDADAAQLDLSKSQKTLYDLMTSAEWANMPDAWKETAVAQFETAQASEVAAEKARRLNELLGKTESSGIEKARADMLLLADAFEKGTITEQQFIEAASTDFEKVGKTIDRFETSITNAFDGMASSIADFAMTGKGSFGGLVDAMVRDLIRLEIQAKAMEAFKAVGGVSGLFGLFKGMFNMGGSEAAISSGSSTVFGPPIASANGNVFSIPSLSAYSGTVVSQPTFFANGGHVMGEAGPEGIFPLKRGADGKLGVSAEGVGGVTVNVINNSGGQASTQQRSDGRGGKIIDVLIEQTKSAIAGDITSGNGSIPAAMASAYGLKRAAGAY